MNVLAPLGIYLGIGAVVGGLLLGRGQPWPTAACAVPCWPWMVGLLVTARASVGPLADAIASAFDSLKLAREEASFPGDLVGDLADLRAALERADQRLALVDRILGSSPAGEPSRPLRAARDRVATEVEAVIADLHALRIQVGLLALSEVRGTAATALQGRLEDLRGRVASLDEIAGVG